MKIHITILLMLVIFSLRLSSQNISGNSGNKNFDTEYELKPGSEVEWTHLNPKRGDKAPKAGTLWGDRNGTKPTGFLLKPSDGFSSPPHIHNVSYRGVVISGLIHNDDPNADHMWMPTASFWTQPKGEVHITSAKGSNTLAYIEIEEGPYLVHPAEEAFQNHERPVNVDESNIVWLDASQIVWIKESGLASSKNSPEVAFLWGNTAKDSLNGRFIKLPAGFKGKIESIGESFKAILIKGNPDYRSGKMDTFLRLDSGSYFASQKNGEHFINTNTDECILYARAKGAFEIIPD